MILTNFNHSMSRSGAALAAAALYGYFFSMWQFLGEKSKFHYYRYNCMSMAITAVAALEP